MTLSTLHIYKILKPWTNHLFLEATVSMNIQKMFVRVLCIEYTKGANPLPVVKLLDAGHLSAGPGYSINPVDSTSGIFHQLCYVINNGISLYQFFFSIIETMAVVGAIIGQDGFLLHTFLEDKFVK